MKYRLSFEIETEQDPSELLEALTQFVESDLPGTCHPERMEVVEPPTVEEIDGD